MGIENIKPASVEAEEVEEMIRLLNEFKGKEVHFIVPTADTTILMLGGWNVGEPQAVKGILEVDSSGNTDKYIIKFGGVFELVVDTNRVKRVAPVAPDELWLIDKKYLDREQF